MIVMMRLVGVLCVSVLLGSSTCLPTSAQVSYSAPGSIYLENFDTLSDIETGKGVFRDWLDNITLPGWFARHGDTTLFSVTQHRVDDGTDSSGGLYSYGTEFASDRALGSIGSNAQGDVLYLLKIKDDTGTTLKQFTLSYRGEQWRAGGCEVQQRLLVTFHIAGFAPVFVPALTFTGPHAGGFYALDGSADATPLSATITGISWAPGAILTFTWTDQNDMSYDHALAIDDVSLVARIPVTLSLSLATVPGSKAVTGKVTLSSKAPTGGAVVQVTNSNPAASMPSSITVPAGATAKSFTITTSAVTLKQIGKVTASYTGLSAAKTLTVRPIGVLSVDLAPNPVVGGTDVTGTVTLEAPAAPGSITVTLKSANTALAVPATSSITIPTGQTTGTFTVKSKPTAAQADVKITATANSVAKSKILTVTP